MKYAHSPMNSLQLAFEVEASSLNHHFDYLDRKLTLTTVQICIDLHLSVVFLGQEK